jgi:hypothetical protein
MVTASTMGTGTTVCTPATTSSHLWVMRSLSPLGRGQLIVVRVLVVERVYSCSRIVQYAYMVLLCPVQLHSKQGTEVYTLAGCCCGKNSSNCFEVSNHNLYLCKYRYKYLVLVLVKVLVRYGTSTGTSTCSRVVAWRTVGIKWSTPVRLLRTGST